VKVGHYGLEGLAIGAVALGVVGLLAAGESCGSGAPGTTCSPRNSESLLIGAGIGAFLGRETPTRAAALGSTMR